MVIRPVHALIPTWNARERLGAVLDALEGQVEAIVVVDNGSRDGTASWLRDARPRVRRIAFEENRGFPAAVNAGTERALSEGARSVLLVNDDARFQPGAVAALADALRAEPRAGAATARLLLADAPDRLNGAGGQLDPRRVRAGLRGAGEPDRGQYDDAPLVDYPSGAAALLRRAAIEEVGPWDERYFLYWEDVDWGLRASVLGWRTVYVPEARVLHAGWTGTRADPARRRYYNLRGRLLFARGHGDARARAHVAGDLCVELGHQALRWPFPSRRRDASAAFLALRDHLAGRYGRSARFG